MAPPQGGAPVDASLRLGCSQPPSSHLRTALISKRHVVLCKPRTFATVNQLSGSKRGVSSWGYKGLEIAPQLPTTRSAASQACVSFIFVFLLLFFLEQLCLFSTMRLSLTSLAAAACVGIAAAQVPTVTVDNVRI